MKLASAVLASLLAATSVAAHATFQELWVGNTDYSDQCLRKVPSNSPVTSVTSSDVACNAGAASSPGYCNVAAGSQVTVEMHQQPGDRSCSNEAIGGNHDGPVIVYMAKVDNALTASGTSAGWFKVAQAGLLSTDYWGTDSLNANCGKFTFTVPSCIPAGDYLLRAEVIALHVASSVGGAQLYMSCYTLKVTGGGSTLPSTVHFPGAYSAQDPGILFNLYGSYTSYTVPGPAVFSCGGGGQTTPLPVPTTTVRPSTTTTTVRPSTTNTSSSSSQRPSSSSQGGGGGSAPLYGQCGGQGWTGPTTCASGTCKYSNAYYSQCVP